MLEPVVETTEEELLFDTSPALFSKLLIRRCQRVLQRKLAFCKTTTKALLKPSFELVALVILRVPPVLTVVLSNLLSSKQRTSPSAVVVSSSRSTSSLGFPGGSLGFTEHAGAIYVIVGLLGHIWILFLEH